MSWLDVLGWAGSALLVFSLVQVRVLRFRVLNLVACIVLVIFNGALGVWPMAALNVALAGINLWFIRKLVCERHCDAVFEVLQVGPLDEYLRHTLRVHAGDIAKFQPGFAWSPQTPGQAAYLVQRGDETVGVVLVRDVGDGVAQVELDYVTPRFRDFSPGEFVFRRSGLFRDRGFQKVITPPGMVAPYYDRLGLRREGESYVMDLS
jgi:HAMP domain-containing protein